MEYTTIEDWWEIVVTFVEVIDASLVALVVALVVGAP